MKPGLNVFFSARHHRQQYSSASHQWFMLAFFILSFFEFLYILLVGKTAPARVPAVSPGFPHRLGHPWTSWEEEVLWWASWLPLLPF